MLGRNHTGATYQVVGGVQAPAAQLAQFPQQTETTRLGTAGFDWHQVVVDKSGDIVTWTTDGTLLATVDTAGMALGGGNILFGPADINGSSSTDPNAPDLLFTLIDNINVVPEPSTLIFALLGVVGLVGMRRRK